MSERASAVRDTMSRHVLGALLAALCLAGSATAGRSAETQDYHALFEARCGSCHGHSSDLARSSLVIEDGALKGRRSGLAVRPFLLRHFGRLTTEQAGVIHDMLRRQLEAGGLFQDRCAICHGRARELARGSLIVIDGALHGRYSGRDIATFLLRHGRLDAREAAEMTDALTQITRGRR